MYVAHLVYPGTFLDGDPHSGFQAQTLISLIDNELADAALALGMYETACSNGRGRDRNEWQQGVDRRREIEKVLTEKRGISWFDREEIDNIRVEVEFEYLKERLLSGNLPTGYLNRLPFVHAKSFIFALDAIRKSIFSLKLEKNYNHAAERALAALVIALPNLAGVRDSTVHADERAVGKARNKPIPSRPIMNEIINAPNGGVIMVGSLVGNNFSCTLAGGEIGAVEVSSTSLFAVQSIVQAMLNELPWRNPKFPRLSPTV